MSGISTRLIITRDLYENSKRAIFYILFFPSLAAAKEAEEQEKTIRYKYKDYCSKIITELVASNAFRVHVERVVRP